MTTNPGAGLVDAIGDQAAADSAAFKQAYKLGYEAGAVVGRTQLSNEILTEEKRFARHMSTITRMLSHAELEERRWGPGGREHFGDPRPGDYMGGPVDWDASEPVAARDEVA